MFNAASELTEVSDDLGLVASYEYDMAGRLSRATDVLGRATKTLYDLAGRAIVVFELDPSGQPLSSTEYDYDEVGPT